MTAGELGELNEGKWARFVSEDAEFDTVESMDYTYHLYVHKDDALVSPQWFVAWTSDMYASVLTLTLDAERMTDGCLPRNLKRFVNLRYLRINSGHLYRLQLAVLPSSVTHLDLNMCYNLSPDISGWAHHTPNLSVLVLPDQMLQGNFSPLPPLQHLRLLIIGWGGQYGHEPDVDEKEKLHEFLVNYRRHAQYLSNHVLVNSVELTHSPPIRRCLQDS